MARAKGRGKKGKFINERRKNTPEGGGRKVHELVKRKKRENPEKSRRFTCTEQIEQGRESAAQSANLARKPSKEDPDG